MSFVIFFILGAVAVAGALMVVCTKSPVAAALCLVLVMCSLAGLFVMLGAVFLAALQVIVYAGAVMVLFLFVIMLLNLRRDEYGHDPRAIQKYLGIALVVIILAQGLVMVSWAIKDYSLDEKSRAAALALAPSDSLAASYSSSPRAVAETLFTKFAYPFEVTSILLLAAIIGAVVIARRRRPAQTQEKESG